MPGITKTINHQNSNPLFKESSQIRQPKQESSKWSSAKTGIAVGVLSTLGLVCSQYFSKKIPNHVIPTTSPAGTLLKVMGVMVLLSPLGYLYKNKSSHTNTKDTLSHFNKSDQELKMDELSKMIDEINADSTNHNFEPITHKEKLNHIGSTLSRFDDCLSPDDFKSHGETLKKFHSLVSKIQPDVATNISNYIKMLLHENTYPELNLCFSEIITANSKAFEEPSLKTLLGLVIEFKKISKQFGSELLTSKKGFEAIFNLTKRLHSLGNLNELIENLDESSINAFVPFILELPKIVEEVLYKPNLLKKLYNDDTYFKKIEVTLVALLNINKQSILNIALNYFDHLIVNPEKNNEQTSLYKNIIMNSVLSNKDFAFDLVKIFVAIGSEEHKNIAEDIWKKIANPIEDAEKYLTLCSSINHPYFQEKLKDHAFIQDSFGISLIKACANHLFEYYSAFPLNGNTALVFKALKDFRFKDEETKEILLPIAQQTVESFRKAKDIRIGDLHGELCNAIRQNLKESESEVSIFDAPHLIDILFGIYFHTKDYKKMNALLSDCFAVRGLENFYSQALDFLESKNDIKWKQIANCEFKDDSPVEQNRLTG